MKKYLEVLQKCKLFDGIEKDNLLKTLESLEKNVRIYRKNQVILSEGEKTSNIGIMLSGTARIVRINYFGNRSILTKINQSELFGESFVCAEIKTAPLNVIAEDNCEVMLIESDKIMRQYGEDGLCEYHSKMVFNLMKVVATKNLLLNRKIEIISKRTTKEKLMTYLLMEAKQQKSSSFTIPYDRQELADFLEVDRSGLSAEIGKLKKEKIIECSRSYFKILKSEQGSISQLDKDTPSL